MQKELTRHVVADGQRFTIRCVVEKSPGSELETVCRLVLLQYPSLLDRSGDDDVWFNQADRHKPTKRRELVLELSCDLPDLSGILPWERELLMPVLQELLEPMLNASVSEDADAQTTIEEE